MTPTADRLLRRQEVERRCQLSRATIYRLMRLGQFPEPIRIGLRAVRWSQREINAYLASPRVPGERGSHHERGATTTGWGSCHRPSFNEWALCHE